MSAPHGPHLSGPEFEAMAAGDAPGPDAERLEVHLRDCSACRKELEAIKRENALFRSECGGASTPSATGVEPLVAAVPLSAHRTASYYWWLGAAALLMLSIGVAYPLLTLSTREENTQARLDTKDEVHPPVASVATGGRDATAFEQPSADGPVPDMPGPAPVVGEEADEGRDARPRPPHPPGPGPGPHPPGPPPHPMGHDMAEGPPPPPHRMGKEGHPPPPHHMGKEGHPPPPHHHRRPGPRREGDEGGEPRQGPPPPPHRAGPREDQPGDGEDKKGEGEKPKPMPRPNPPRPPRPVVSHGVEVGELVNITERSSGITYEGKTAKQWLEQIENKWDVEKATHALGRIGADAVPALLEQLRSGDEEFVKRVKAVLASLQPSLQNKGRYIKLLSDNHFEVRRMAVNLLEPMVEQDAEVERAVRGALKDRDMAVVEAAEKALLKVKERDAKTQATIKEWMAMAGKAEHEARFSEATKLYAEVLAKDPGHAEAKARLNRIQVMQISGAAEAQRKAREAELQKKKAESEAKEPQK